MSTKSISCNNKNPSCNVILKIDSTGHKLARGGPAHIHNYYHTKTHINSQKAWCPQRHMKYSQQKWMIDCYILSQARRARRLTVFHSFSPLQCGRAASQANYLSVLPRSLLGLSCHCDVQRLIHYREWFFLFKGLLEKTRPSDSPAPNWNLLLLNIAQPLVAYALCDGLSWHSINT